MNKTRFLALVAAVVLLMAIPFTASGQVKVPPHLFIGSATGTTVSALVDGAEVATATIADGSYSIKVGVDEAYTGQTVNFQIDGADAIESADWVQGGADELNLTVSAAEGTAEETAS